MRTGWRALGRRTGFAIALGLLGVIALGGSPASAAGPPLLSGVSSSAVAGTSAQLDAEINPNGLVTNYHFEYLSAAAYEGNLGSGKEAFAGAAKAPSGAKEAELGAGTAEFAVFQQVVALKPETGYRFRLVASNSAGPAVSEALAFTTLSPPPIACIGDACQVLPPEPVDPALGTTRPGPGNPKVHYRRARHRRCQRRAREGKPRRCKPRRGAKR